MSRRKKEEEAFFYELLHKMGGRVDTLEHRHENKDVWMYERTDNTEGRSPLACVAVSLNSSASGRPIPLSEAA